MFKKEFSNSVAKALESANNQTLRVMVGISGAPIELLTRVNKPYLIVNIADNTGSIGMKVWDMVPTALESFKSGSIWSIKVQKSTYEGNPQLTFVPGESELIDPATLEPDLRADVLKRVARVYNVNKSSIATLFGAGTASDRPDIDAVFKYVFGINGDADMAEKVMFSFLRAEDNDIESALLELKEADLFINDEAFEDFRTFCYCPAAKGHHGAYIHGLLAHVEAMIDAVGSYEAIYQNSASMRTKPDNELSDFVDFPAIKLACAIHDWGKTREYTFDAIGTIDYADEQGEQLFYHDMRMAFRLQAMPCEDDATRELVEKLTHMILRHHGEWADYQPNKRLKTFVESDIFHYIDVIEARIVGAIEG